jgi:dihydrofolate reductase
VSKLKQEPGKDILMHGCGSLAREWARHGLVDEFQMWVHPVVWGRGDLRERIFHGAGDGIFLKLVDATTFASGVVILSYRAAEGE